MCRVLPTVAYRDCLPKYQTLCPLRYADYASSSVDADGVGSIERLGILIIKFHNWFYFTQFLSKEDEHLI